MNLKHLLRRALLLVCACVLLGACDNSDYNLSGKDKQAFKDATPDIRLEWEKALKADKANDYLAANTSFRFVLTQKITPDQLVAVQTALGGLNERMNDAAAKGNVSAQKALEALKAGGPRR
jgi:hypothetical protein